MKRITFIYGIFCIGVTLVGKEQYSEYDKGVFDGAKNLAQTISIVGNQYVQDIDPKKPLRKAISSFIQTLDPHSSFLDEEAYTEIIRSTKGELCGIGIIVDNTKEEDDEFLRIIDTLPAGPADNAGLRPNDKIVAVDDQPVKGMTLEETIAKLKGKPKTTVDVKIQRNDASKLLDITIERDIVKEPNALCYQFTDHNAYYLCLNMFTENSVKQVEEILKKIQHQPSRGLILDLRNNSGGLLTAVIDILGLFIGKDKLVVSTKGKNNTDSERYLTRRDAIKLNTNLPILIIVNNYTASAAEILAGCLQFYADQPNTAKALSRIFVVGIDTFGKGSVQEVIPLGNNTALKLTTRLYYLPNKNLIQGIGIIPDFKIEPKIAPSQETSWFNTVFGREKALKNTIKVDPKTQSPLPRDEKQEKIPKQPKKEDKPWHEKRLEIISTDYTILNSLRLLELLHLIEQLPQSKLKSRKETINMINQLFITNDKIAVQQVLIQ